VLLYSKVGKAISLLPLLERHLDKLPLTGFFLRKVTESQEQYQIRRVLWAAAALEARGESVRAWKIVRLAGLRKGYPKGVGDAIANEVRRSDRLRARKVAG
jgi:hypothetical protein